MMITAASSTTLSVPKQEAIGCNVFVGVMPIRLPRFAPRPVASILAQAGLLHFYTVIQQPSSDPPVYTYFDFLPETVEDPLQAIGALLGQKIPGIVQERNLRRLPVKSCWWVGRTGKDKGLESVRMFNNCWDNQLSLFRKDCRHYTHDLVTYLTGKTGVIEEVIQLKKIDKDPVRMFIDYQ